MTRLPRSLAAAALALALVVTPLSPLASTAAHAATLTFSDDFNAGPLNTGVWKTVLPWGTQYNQREQQWYDPANLSWVNSGLRITTKQGYDNGYPYSSGIVTSKNQMSYGYFEFRAKLPKGPGIWPALWLLNDGTQEIDVMELLGNTPNKIYMTYHRSGTQVYQTTYTLPSGDFSQAYHTFAVDVQPSYIRWYVDGVQRGSYSGSIPSNTGNIIVNTAVGDSTSWPGAPTSATTFPQILDLDYIHAYNAMPTATTNNAPVATADTYSVNQDTALSIAAPGVLANDTDADGNALSAVIATQPSHGTVSLSGNGSFVYTPAAGYVGSDSFTYKASDGSLQSSAASVNITVKAVNHAPVASADTYAVNQDSALSIAAPGVLGNDTDADGDLLTAALVSQPSHGTVALSSNGSFIYTPAAGYTGADSFTYRASDGTLQSAATPVNITVNAVNHAPVASADSYGMNQDGALSIAAPGVLGNDTDADGNALTAVLATQPGHGTVTLAADGSFVYTPAAGWSGTDSFTYRASDGSMQSGTAMVTVAVAPVVVTPPATDPGTMTPPPADPGTVTPPPADPGTVTPAPNAAPVSADDTYQGRTNTTLSIPAPGVLGNDTDADGDALTAQLVAQPANGTVTLGADGSFLYTPNTGFAGTDTFTYQASDGTTLSPAAKVTVNVKSRGRSVKWRTTSTSFTTLALATWTSAGHRVHSLLLWARGWVVRFFQ